jgi:hypothetical protein
VLVGLGGDVDYKTGLSAGKIGGQPASQQSCYMLARRGGKRMST